MCNDYAIQHYIRSWNMLIRIYSHMSQGLINYVDVLQLVRKLIKLESNISNKATICVWLLVLQMINQSIKVTHHRMIFSIGSRPAFKQL